MLKNSFQENGTRHAMMSYQHVKTSCPTSCYNSCFNKIQPIHVYRPNKYLCVSVEYSISI